MSDTFQAHEDAALSYDQVKALATGDPMLMEKAAALARGRRELPQISDAAHRIATGKHLDLNGAGPWHLTGFDIHADYDVHTGYDGPLDDLARARLADSHPHVVLWQAHPDPRRQFTAGLRELADLIDANAGIPLPYDGTDSPITFHFWGEPARGQMAAAARAFPVALSKTSSSDTYFRLTGRLAGTCGLKIQLVTDRDAVCERVVVGVEDREVDEVVTPAVTRKVIKPTEVVEWRCHPLLAPADSDGQPE